MSEGGLLPPVVARLTANISEFQAKMGEAKGEMAEVEATSGKMGGKLAAIGKGLVLGSAAAAVGIAAYGVHAGMAMQKADGALAAHGDLSAAQAKRIGDAFLNTGGKFTESGKDMVTALAPVAGQLKLLDGHTLTAKESMDVMSNSLALAEASGNDFGNTTKDVVSIMQAFHVQAGHTAEVTDQLFAVSNTTGVGIDALTTTYGRLKGKLGDVVPSMGDLSATIVDLTEHGVTGKAAVMGMTSGLTTLLSGSKKVSDETKTLGLHLYDASGKFVGMRNVVAQLGPKLKGMSDQQRSAALAMLFGKGASHVLNQTLTAGVGAYDKAAAAVSRKGQAEEAAKKATANLHDQMKKLGVAVENIATKLGEWLIPKLVSVATWITSTVIPAIQSLWTRVSPYVHQLGDLLASVFDNQIMPALHKVADFIKAHVVPIFTAMAHFVGQHKEILQGFAVVVGGIVVAALAAYTVGTIAAGIATLAAWFPVIAVVAILTAIVAAVIYAYNHFKWFHDGVQAAAHGIAAAAAWMWNSVLKPAFSWIVHFVRNDLIPAAKAFMVGAVAAWHGISAGASAMWGVLRPIFQLIGAVLHLVGSIVGALWRNIFVPAFRGIGMAVSAAWSGVIQPALSALQGMFRTVATVAGWLWHNIFQPVFAGIGTAVFTAWGVIKPILDFITGAIQDVSSGIDSLGTVWGNIWDGMHRAISSIWDKIKPIIDTIKSAVGGISGVISTVGSALHHIPGFAEGTRSAPGGVALVGERGPELVQLPGGSRVFTSSQTRSMIGSPGPMVSRAGGSGGGGGDHYTVIQVDVAGSVIAENELGRYLRTLLLQSARGLPGQNLFGQYAGS